MRLIIYLSYPEKITISLLDQLKINYIHQLTKKNFKWCGKYKYDFYIPKYNMIIEVHGMQHYEQTSGVFVSYENQHTIDDTKKNIALSNNIRNYLELDCRYSNLEYIKKSILSSDLIKYFNLSKLDWNMADEYSTKNIVKEICIYYEKYKNEILLKDIASHFNICYCTLIKYLKKGNKYNWCDYVPRSNSEILRKTRSKNINKNIHYKEVM